MCSVVMDTDDGMADYGLWDRTLMEVDLLEENYRHEEIDYLNRGAFLESDPLLPLINTIVSGGGNEDDASQLFLALSSKCDRSNSTASSGTHSSPSSAASDAASDVDVDQAGVLYGFANSVVNGSVLPDSTFQLPAGIVIKTEPLDAGSVRSLWLGPDGHLVDSDTSSVASPTGGRSPVSTGQARILPFTLQPPTPPCSSDGENFSSPLNTPSRSPGNIASLSLATAISSSLATSEDGTLLLTEEEKRTLIAEGYPIPARLPLSKAEERSLKRIRRKIKNKISAQESRRKKKEYIESLEKKVKNLNEDNSELRRRLETSEATNRTLADQLCKYQALLKGKVQIPAATVSIRRAVPNQTEKVIKQE
ncbi:cyclic AMP-responsive element-binding protein 3-like protein 3-A [Paramacrobiotus metropolitanus]|uniref:cyclic AMP-responsive element-binding protein 3-like protein 3-A n=1 Tax=Paramacrobiotus metropolitanus TaxID=2943436 RepID=UPI0024458102|nr:cyclic AMP-responsive element-binding protein 3-like protein 3-A [Paramacrobiotus metropolitanus]